MNQPQKRYEIKENNTVDSFEGKNAMTHLELPSNQVEMILQYLKSTAAKPSIRHLNQLIAAYIDRVPWESATRIVKHRTTKDQENRPRWPAEFWEKAIQTGSGGTCFETNYAFFSLLYALGYTGYMTINDMGETRACHAAVVIYLSGGKYLVDVSIPFEKALHIRPYQCTRRITGLQSVTLVPDADRTFRVFRTPHPRPYVFTLIDSPVRVLEYEDAVIRDYGENGFFLDRVVIVKKVNDRVWRFNGAEKPYRLEAFGRAGKLVIELSAGELIHALSQHFALSESAIEAAIKFANPELVQNAVTEDRTFSTSLPIHQQWLRQMA